MGRTSREREWILMERCDGLWENAMIESMWQEKEGAIYYRCSTYESNKPEDKMAPLQLMKDNSKLYKWRTIEGVQLRTQKKAALERPRVNLNDRQPGWELCRRERVSASLKRSDKKFDDDDMKQRMIKGGVVDLTLSPSEQLQDTTRSDEVNSTVEGESTPPTIVKQTAMTVGQVYTAKTIAKITSKPGGQEFAEFLRRGDKCVSKFESSNGESNRDGLPPMTLMKLPSPKRLKTGKGVSFDEMASQAEKNKKEKNVKQCNMMSMTRCGKLSMTKACLAMPLHSLSYIGIDTCSALSVSIVLADFINLDKSQQAKDSVQIRGVGGTDTNVGGRGMLIVKTVDFEGSPVWIIDPEAVYIEGNVDNPDFRVMGREQWKKNGLRVVEGGSPQDDDIMQDVASGMGVSLTDCGGILCMKTIVVTDSEKAEALQYKGKIGKGGQSAMVWKLDESSATLPNQGETQPNDPHDTTRTTLATSTYGKNLGMTVECQLLRI
jgi:hypothetical protein